MFRVTLSLDDRRWPSFQEAPPENLEMEKFTLVFHTETRGINLSYCISFAIQVLQEFALEPRLGHYLDYLLFFYGKKRKRGNFFLWPFKTNMSKTNINENTLVLTGPLEPSE